MSYKAYRIMSGVTCIVSLTSVFGSSYLLRSWLKKRKQNKQELLDEYIAYMSLVEFLSAILYFIFWSNPAMDWDWISKLSHNGCIMLGAFNQFLQILTTTFNFGLSAFIFLPIVRGTPMNVIESRKMFHLSFIFAISILCTIIPFVHDHYGFADDDATNYGLSKYQCWITQKDANYYLCLYIPAGFYVLFAFCLMLYARLKINNEYYQILIDQLTWYTVAFIWVWFFGILNRIYNTFISSTTPFWLISARIVCESSMGTVRAIIWRRYLKKSQRKSDAIDKTSFAESAVKDDRIHVMTESMLADDRRIHSTQNDSIQSTK